MSFIVWLPALPTRSGEPTCDQCLPSSESQMAASVPFPGLVSYPAATNPVVPGRLAIRLTFCSPCPPRSPPVISVHDLPFLEIQTAPSLPSTGSVSNPAASRPTRVPATRLIDWAPEPPSCRCEPVTLDQFSPPSSESHTAASSLAGGPSEPTATSLPRPPPDTPWMTCGPGVARPGSPGARLQVRPSCDIHTAASASAAPATTADPAAATVFPWGPGLATIVTAPIS